jgi:hypothetical protein
MRMKKELTKRTPRTPRYREEVRIRREAPGDDPGLFVFGSMD